MSIADDLRAFRLQAQTESNEALNPATIRIGGGEAIPAATNGIKTARAIEEGGFVNQQRVNFCVRRDLLPDVLPISGALVLWVEKSTTVRLDSINDNSDTDPTVLLECIGAAE